MGRQKRTFCKMEKTVLLVLLLGAMVASVMSACRDRPGKDCSHCQKWKKDGTLAYLKMAYGQGHTQMMQYACDGCCNSCECGSYILPQAGGCRDTPGVDCSFC